MRQQLTGIGLGPTLSHRSAYTLIEMLIASILVAALMSVVWSMMSLYNGYLRAGQSQAVEQQLIRSILHLLEEDLQGVAITDTNPAVKTTIEVSGMSATEMPGTASPQTIPFSVNVDELSAISDTVKLSSGTPPGRISLIGNSDAVRLSIEHFSPAPSGFTHISASPPGQIPAESSGANPLSQTVAGGTLASANDVPAIEGVAPDVAEFQMIIWQFQPRDAASSGSRSLRPGLYRIQAESLSLQTALGQKETMVEDRVHGDDASVDRMTLETLLFPPMDNPGEAHSIASNDPATPLTPLFDVIPEVVGCRFEYFSGSAWSTSWNSEQQQSLPLAIRVRLRFVTPADLAKLDLVIGTTGSPDSLLDNNLNAGTDAQSLSPPVLPGALEDPSADPFASIPGRQIQRIVILQPLRGPMPQPGSMEDTEAFPARDNPVPSETML